MKKRNLILGILVCALAIVMAGCGQSDSSAGSDSGSADSTESSSGSESAYTIGLVLKTATNEHFRDMAYGAQMAAKDYGVTVEVLNTTDESDAEGQLKLCEDLISAGVDALCLTPNDSKGLSTAVQDAYDEGIAFVAVDTEIENIWGDDYLDYVPVYVGVDWTETGYDMATLAAEAIGGEGKVAVIRGVDAASSSVLINDGVTAALEEYDGIEVVANQTGDFDTETTQTRVGNILQSDPDVDAIICANDLEAIGAINALNDQNIEIGGEDGVIVTGMNATLVGLQSVINGEMYATVYDWSILQGYWAVYDAISLLEGDIAPEETMAPCTIITADNADKYVDHATVLSNWSIGDSVE